MLRKWANTIEFLFGAYKILGKLISVNGKTIPDMQYYYRKHYHDGPDQ